MELLAQLPLLLGDGEVMNGWGNLALQGGAFSLLVYIVVYLGPLLLRESRSERETRDTKFEGIVKQLQDGFEKRNAALVAAVGIQTDKLVTEMKRESDDMTLVLANACNYEGAKPRPPRSPRTHLHEGG